MTKQVGTDPVMAKNRPRSIIWFERLFWSSVFASYLGDRLLDETILYSIWIEIILLSLMASVWYLIARRANNILKWIYAVLAFVGMGLFGLVVIASVFEAEFLDNESLAMSGAEIAFGCVTNILSAGAAICLFLRPSRIWFESKGKVVGDSDHLLDVFK